MNPNDILTQFNNVYDYDTPDTFLDNQATKAKALIDDSVSYIVDKVFNSTESKQCDKFKIKKHGEELK
jgi:hypothetical protein